MTITACLMFLNFSKLNASTQFFEHIPSITSHFDSVLKMLMSKFHFSFKPSVTEHICNRYLKTTNDDCEKLTNAMNNI